jgi:4'-phosphopantetheinyl transferase
MIRVYYTILEKPQDPDLFQHYLELMPNIVKENIFKYRRWQDALACLLGKLLLLEGLRSFGYPASTLQNIQYTAHNRPYFSIDIDFNIAHADGLVACAVSDTGSVGIDVEKIEAVPLQDFKNIWSNDEWRMINDAVDSYVQFFRLWTMKEAAMKADGRGLSIPLPEVKLGRGKATIGTSTWILKELFLDPAFMIHIASGTAEMPPVQSSFLTFN